MEKTKELLAHKMAELVKEGINFEYIAECALTDVIKDMYCIAQGWSKWPEEGNIVDNLHDWAHGIASLMIKGLEIKVEAYDD